MEEPVLIVSINAGDEESGEGENQDFMEEILAPPEALQIRLNTQARFRKLPLKMQASTLEIVHEVILPPPEKL